MYGLRDDRAEGAGMALLGDPAKELPEGILHHVGDPSDLVVDLLRVQALGSTVEGQGRTVLKGLLHPGVAEPNPGDRALPGANPMDYHPPGVPGLMGIHNKVEGVGVTLPLLGLAVETAEFVEVLKHGLSPLGAEAPGFI